MSFIKKLISCLLLMAIMLSLIPFESMPYDIMPEVWAGVKGHSDIPGSWGTDNDNGGLASMDNPTIMVSLSRDARNYLDGTEKRDGSGNTDSYSSMLASYNLQFPEDLDLSNSLFFVQSPTFKKMMERCNTPLKDTSQADWGNIGLFTYYDTDLTIDKGHNGQIRCADITQSKCPENKFLKRAIELYANNTITSLVDLESTWMNEEMNMLPTLEEAQEVMSYICKMPSYQKSDIAGHLQEFVEGQGNSDTDFTSLKKTEANGVDGGLNLKADGSKTVKSYKDVNGTFNYSTAELTPEENFITGAGYAGLLACLYVIARDANGLAPYGDGTKKANTKYSPENNKSEDGIAIVVEYASAISDYLGKKATSSKPVSLVIEVACNITYYHIDYIIGSVVDIIGYSYLVPGYADLTTKNAMGSYASLGISGDSIEDIKKANTKEFIKKAAEISAEKFPATETQSSTNPSGPVRAFDEDVDIHNPIAFGRRIYTFNDEKYLINSKSEVISDSNAGKPTSAYLDLLRLDESSTGHKGFIIASAFREAPPRTDELKFNITVDNSTIQSSGSACDPVVNLKDSPKITVKLIADTNTIDFFKTKIETVKKAGSPDYKLHLVLNISREINDVITGSRVVAENGTKKELETLKIDKEYTGDDLIQLLQGKAIVLQDKEILDMTFNKENIVMTKEIRYDATCTLEYDYIDGKYNTVLKFEHDDLFTPLDGDISDANNKPTKFADSTLLSIPAYMSDIQMPEDVGVAGGDLDPETQKHNPVVSTYMMSFEYTNKSQNFAEVKVGSPNDNEVYEAMAGVPSTENLYFSVGGTEFMVSMAMQYWVNLHNRERTYLIHFDGTNCEYNNNEKGKGDVFNPQDAINAFNAQCKSFGGNATISLTHDGGMTISATWTGSIPNDAESSIQITAPATSHGNHETSASGTIVAIPNTVDYDEAVTKANNFMSAVATWSSNLTWTAASDKKTRTVHIETMNLNTGGSTTSPGASGGTSDSCSESTWLNGSASATFNNPATVDKTVTNSSVCNEVLEKSHMDPDYDSEGKKTGEHKVVDVEHKDCTATSPAKTETLNKDPDGSFTITVEYTLEPHALCGPCCGHVLPDLYDGWKQGLVFDTVMISQMLLFRLDEGRVDGMSEVLGTDEALATIKAGSPTYFMNNAAQNEINARFLKGRTELDAVPGDTWMQTYQPLYKDLVSKSGVTSRDNMIRWFSDSLEYSILRTASTSRNGRLRYFMPSSPKAPDNTITYQEQGKDAGTKTFTIDYSKVVSPLSHDDVVYNYGKRSANCDGMATTENFKKNKNNVDPTTTTGHVNEWADGCLYTYMPGQSIAFNYYDGTTTVSSSYGANYKTGIANDANAMSDTYYDETYDRHTQKVGGLTSDKTDYSDKADSKDEQTPEWKFFDKARNTPIGVKVITDFLILQTSGGDQCLFYYEQDSKEDTTAQQHFSKVKISGEDAFNKNPLSIWTFSLSCDKMGGSSNNYKGLTAEDITNAGGISGNEAPQYSYGADYIKDCIVIGGYNGRADKADMKYRPYSIYAGFLPYTSNITKEYNTATKTGTYSPLGGTHVITSLENDPAGTIKHPSRPSSGGTTRTTGFTIYDGGLQIVPTTRNQKYTFGTAKAYYIQTEATVTYIWDNRKEVDKVVDARFPSSRNNASDQQQMELGWPTYAKIGDIIKTDYGTISGLLYNTSYYSIPTGYGTTEKSNGSVNDIIVFTPVSTEYAMVLPQGSLTYLKDGATSESVSRDQRTNTLEVPSMNDVVKASKVCPRVTDQCEFSYLNCTYAEPSYLNLKGLNKDAFDSKEDQIVSSVNNKSWLLNKLNLTYNTSNVIDIKMTVPTLSLGDKGSVVLASFNGIAFYVEKDRYGFVVLKDQTNLPTQVKELADKQKLYFGQQAFATGNISGKTIEIQFSFSNIQDCAVFVKDGTDYNKKTLTVSELKTVISETTTPNGGKHKVTSLVMKEIGPNDMASSLPSAAIGDTLYIGGKSKSFDGTVTQNTVNLSNVSAALVHTTEHTSACFNITTVHKNSTVHVHTKDCEIVTDKAGLWLCNGQPLNAPSNSATKTYHVHTDACVYLPYGSYICDYTNYGTGTSTFNKHVHNSACFTLRKAAQFTNKSSVQKYIVPTTGTYSLEVFRGKVYGKLELTLEKNTVLYVEVNNKNVSVRTYKSLFTGVKESVDDPNSVAFNKADELKREEISRLIWTDASKAYYLKDAYYDADNKDAIDNVINQYKVNFEHSLKATMSSSSDENKVRITRVIPIDNHSTVYDNVVNGLYTKEELEKYVGKDLANELTSAPVMATYSNFSYDDTKTVGYGANGTGNTNQAIGFKNGKLICTPGEGGDEFNIPVTIGANALKQIEIKVVNKTASNSFRLYCFDNKGHYYNASVPMVANSSVEQTLYFQVGALWQNLDITKKIVFDPVPGTNIKTGTIEISSIVLKGYGSGTLTPSSQHPTIYSVKDTVDGDFSGFTAIAGKITTSTASKSMKVEPSSATYNDARVQFSAIENIDFTNIDYIRIEFALNTNEKKNDYGNLRLNADNDTYSYIWSIADVKNQRQVVYIDLKHKSTYNTYNGVFTMCSNVQDTISNLSTNYMLFDFCNAGQNTTNDSINTITVYDVAFLGGGTATGKGTIKVEEKNATTSYSPNDLVEAYKSTSNYNTGYNSTTHELHVEGGSSGIVAMARSNTPLSGVVTVNFTTQADKDGQMCGDFEIGYGSSTGSDFTSLYSYHVTYDSTTLDANGNSVKNQTQTVTIPANTYLKFRLNKHGSFYRVHAWINSITAINMSTAMGFKTQYDCTKTIQKVTLNPGTYILEAWGAQGGTASGKGGAGGKGGYSSGVLVLSEPTTLYIGVGSQGMSDIGGYNGGGNAFTLGGAGGGATHIAIADGLLQNLSKDKVLLVAGAGGGGSSGQVGGYGGGANMNGETVAKGSYGQSGTGGSLESGGTGGSNNGTNGGFGFGGYNNSGSSSGGGGGGAGLYGGGAGGNDYSAHNDDDDTPGSGGSGYADLNRLTGVTGQSNVNTGNGKVVITPLHYTVTTIDKLNITTKAESQTNVNIKYDGNVEDAKRATNKSLLDTAANNGTIPDTLRDGTRNPIWTCEDTDYNVHVCIGDNGEQLCSTVKTLECTEPHHRGEHYNRGNDICYDYCGNDANHQDSIPSSLVGKEGAPTVPEDYPEFLQIDEGFTVYFPNRGDFGDYTQGNVHIEPGLRELSQFRYTNGNGYCDYMDTTPFTREKRVRFSFDVLYSSTGDKKDVKIYPANTWIDLDVLQEYFYFYLPVADAEVTSAKIDFEVEAINCGTGIGLKTNAYTSSAKYSEATISDKYKNAITDFVTNFAKYIDEALTNGKKVTIGVEFTGKGTTFLAPLGGNVLSNTTTYRGIYENYLNNVLTNKGVGHGFYDFFREGLEKEIVKAENAKKAGIESLLSQFIGKEFDATGYKKEQPLKWTHYGKSNEDNGNNGINENIKRFTLNDNQINRSNQKRSTSFESLHGGYSTRYLALVGRIGNMSIQDTGDFRFDNFFKKEAQDMSVESIKNDLSNWLVAGVVPVVDRSIQKNYIGDTYDIRGNKAYGTTTQLNTHNTQGWASKAVSILNAQSYLSGSVNNIKQYTNEQLHYGYEIFGSIETMGNYYNGNLEIVPYYYALKLTDEHVEGLDENYQAKGSIIPLNVFMTMKGDDGTEIYPMINYFGNVKDGNANSANKTMADYFLNLNWPEEQDRRQFFISEIQATRDVQDYFKVIIRKYQYDESSSSKENFTFEDVGKATIDRIVEYTIPIGDIQLMGNAQYLLLDGKHRTFIGSSTTYNPVNSDNENIWGNGYSVDIEGTNRDYTPLKQNFGTSMNAISYNGTSGYINEAYYQRAVQRWHWKLGLPSSAIFLPATDDKVTTDNMNIIMDEDGIRDEFVILCTATFRVVGDTWSLAYSQPWLSKITIGGTTYTVAKEYAGKMPENIDDLKNITDENGVISGNIPPLIAIIGGDSSSADIEIVHTH